MTMLLASMADSAESWAEGLRTANLPMDLRIWPNIGNSSEIDYAIVAHPPRGLLADLPNLKAILSLWAGVDHITSDPTWPKHIPIYRMIEPGLTGGMVEFVLSQVLNLHLSNYDSYDAFKAGIWERAPRGSYGHEPMVGDRTVGMLGLGEMGRNCADALVRAGFRVAGWSRSKKALAGINCYHGVDGMDAVLRQSDILVNLLPLTPETENILNAEALAKLPRGAGLVQVGRGQHVVDADLIAALDSGQISRAVLDVFREEPLPADHPFWAHPRTVIFPHIASVTRVRTGVPVLIDSLKALSAGRAPEGLFNPARGY